MRRWPALLMIGLPLAAPAAAESPHGLWRTPPNAVGAYADIRVGPCAGGSGTICGVIERVHNAPAGVPDVTGRVIMRDMAERDGRWTGGTVWAPDEDRTYRGRVFMTADGLRLEGCVLGGLICRGQTWTRLE
jgi:uncharacterized protein (DUF2147 family)